MKNKLLTLFFVVTFFALTAPAASAVTNGIVKVGLRYGSSALASANLENAEGAGYEFGYYDEDRRFVALGQTDVTTITMTPSGGSSASLPERTVTVSVSGSQPTSQPRASARARRGTMVVPFSMYAPGASRGEPSTRMRVRPLAAPVSVRARIRPRARRMLQNRFIFVRFLSFLRCGAFLFDSRLGILYLTKQVPRKR